MRKEVGYNSNREVGIVIGLPSCALVATSKWSVHWECSSVPCATQEAGCEFGDQQWSVSGCALCGQRQWSRSTLYLESPSAAWHRLYWPWWVARSIFTYWEFLLQEKLSCIPPIQGTAAFMLHSMDRPFQKKLSGYYCPAIIPGSGGCPQEGWSAACSLIPHWFCWAAWSFHNLMKIKEKRILQTTASSLYAV